MKVGFTGTRRGMTKEQIVALRGLLNAGEGEFHHGDCIGADAQAHDIAVGMGYAVVIHPPQWSSLRAFRQSDRIESPRPYLWRNQHIVMCTETLIAAPAEKVEQWAGSGTWSTVRYARKMSRKTTIIFPDGTIG